MGRPGRPPGSTVDLDARLGADGDLIDTIEPIKKAKKEPDKYTFELVGHFPKDPENGTIRYPPSINLQNQDTLYDDEKGTSRQARLLRGVTSIWLDDQKDITDKFADRNRPELSFKNGQLTIPSHEKNMIQFLLLRSDFEGCKHPAVNKKIKYRLIDTEGEESKKLEFKKKVKEAYDLAWKTPMEELIPHAKFLGISFTNDKGLDKSDDALRTDYVDKAVSAADLFLRTYNNPKVKTYGLVKAAFEQSIIVYVDGQAQWADTKSVICQIPYEKQGNVADYLAELMLTKDGIELRSRLENL